MTAPSEELKELTEVPRPRRLALKVRKAAARIDVGASKMYQLVARGEIPAIRIDGSIRIPLEDLYDWVKERKEREELRPGSEQTKQTR